MRVRPLRILGLLLVSAGLALLGYVGWQLWGTSWVSERRHEELVTEVERQWRSGREGVDAEEGRVASIVRIPRFGDDFAVPLLEGTSDEALAAGMSHFTDSAEPGARGNFAVAGHRVTHGEPLRDMPELAPGDEVVVETAEATYTYLLDTGGDDLSVAFDDGWVLDELPANPDPGGPGPADHPRLITLVTCAELFHTDDRLVAFGHLESKDPRK